MKREAIKSGSRRHEGAEAGLVPEWEWPDRNHPQRVSLGGSVSPCETISQEAISTEGFGGTIGKIPALCRGMKASKKSPSASSRGRAQDRRKISLQRHEIDHVVAKLQEEFRPIIKQAVLAAKRALGGETRRNQVMVEARRRLLAHA
jgi:hypothetical protein